MSLDFSKTTVLEAEEQSILPGWDLARPEWGQPGSVSIRHILLVIDESLLTEQALEMTAYLAILSGAQVSVVQAYRPGAKSAFGAYFLANAGLRNPGQARTFVRQAASRLRSMGVQQVHPRAIPDSAPDAVLQYARRTSADLIIVGEPRRRSWLGKFFSGGCLDLIRRANIPVLVAHQKPGE